MANPAGIASSINVHPEAPSVQTKSLDTVWFQVGGTICNLRCNHCFISCSPENDKFHFLSLETCRRHLQESAELGVKDYYFTGGEPFANPEICDILELALGYGEATVLTNATLFRDKVLDRLEQISRKSDHAMEIRVSIDGYNAAMNDPIRGEGTFDRAMKGVRQLVERGFQPIITITRTWDGNDNTVLAQFVQSLRDIGYQEPRLKILPLLKIGEEAQRGGAYCREARVTHEMMANFDQGQLLCSNTRLVTDQGVWTCPILLDAPDARVGDTLAESLGIVPLSHSACYTCWQYGAICSNSTCTSTNTCDA